MSSVAIARPVDKIKCNCCCSAKVAPKQPDIAYHPNREIYLARTARRLAEDPSLLQAALPDGFPEQLQSSLVWEGKDFKDEKEWVYELNPDQLEEIDAAVKHFRSLGKPLGHLSPSTFPLPTLGPVLRDLSKELHTGRGFFVLRTIPVDNYTREENVILYGGVSSHVGELRGVQDQNGKTVLAHIKDMTPTLSNEAIGAPAYTKDKQVYHNDLGDIIALFALEVASEGGASRISSSWKAYNELAATRPDLIKTLCEPWPREEFGGNPPYVSRPLLFYHDNKIIIQYARRYFTGYQGLTRSPDIPPITEAQAEALDALHYMGEKFNLGLNFQKGDIQYINNLSVFHARDGFIDTPEHTRHLLRMWLRNEELAWKLPEELHPQWHKLYYSVTPDEQEITLDPTMRDGTKGKAQY